MGEGGCGGYDAMSGGEGTTMGRTVRMTARTTVVTPLGQIDGCRGDALSRVR